MSTFILFSEALSSSAVGELFGLGYNYIPNFHEKEFALNFLLILICSLLTKSGAPTMLILQSPTVSWNGYVNDV